VLNFIPGSVEERSGSPSPPPQEVLTLRALVSTKDAGVIIGKGGKNVADLREQTGVKAGVSKVVPGVHDRVLTVSGNVDAVAKVYFSLHLALVSPHHIPDRSPTRFSAGIQAHRSATS
jgi:heterogeneous nuclear rnp K-like protein 2